jgi:hypothetical protein
MLNKNCYVKCEMTTSGQGADTMSRPMNPTIFRIVGIAMIAIAIFNVAPSLALFGTGTPPPTGDNNAVGVEDESATEDAIESTGGITTTMGMLTLVHAPVMIAVGIALLLMKRWEFFAALMLGIDILVKIGTLLNNAVAADPNPALYLTPVVIAVIDAVLAYVILQQWNARRHGDTRVTRENSSVRAA